MKYILWLLHKVFSGIAYVANYLRRTTYIKLYHRKFKPRDNDIYIATYPKSGTTWMQMILYQLTTKGEMDFKHIYQVSPFLDWAVDGGNYLNQFESTRIMKTHFSYQRFPKRIKGKIIYITRNGIDVAVSQFYHYNSLDDKLTFENALQARFYRKSMHWFEHVSGWMQNNKNLDILYLHYEDILDDLEGNIRKVADFCNIPIDENEMPRILERSSFQFMKQHQDKLSPFVMHKPNDFIRKGKKGEGYKYFNEQDRTEYMENFTKFFGQNKMPHYQFTKEMELAKSKEMV